MDIKVLGSSCAKCKTLEKITREAVDQLQIDATIEKVEDIQKIVEYGVMFTPALVVDGEVVVKGRVPKLDEVKSLLNKILVMMKKIKVVGLMLVLSFGVLFVQSCNSTEKENKEETIEENVYSEVVEEATTTAYYFHATRRCATCQAVEKVSKEYIEANYAEKVTFISINREEDKNSELVEKYEIAGQTLLLVFGDEVVNLTTEAFLNARTKPEKLEELIKSAIDARLK